MMDCCVRLLPGVMGAANSAHEESFEDGLLEYPHYTRPAEWRGRAVPPVLLSGRLGGTTHREVELLASLPPELRLIEPPRRGVHLL